MGKRLLVVLAFVLIASCSVPETRIYSIYMPGSPTAAPAGSAASASVVVTSPKYLAQPYIACRNSPYQVEIAKYSKWDSSPSEIIRDAFRDFLLSTGLYREVRTSRVAPEGFQTLKINLKRFERFHEGDVPFAELSFDISLTTSDDRELLRKVVSKKTRLEDRTFLALAKGMSSALSEALSEVRADLAGVSAKK